MNPPSDESDGPHAEMLPAAEFHQSREKASRFAVLGMLSLGEKLSGYNIRKVISESTANFWSESYGNIYPVLKKLLAEGAILVAEDESRSGNRRRRLYSITADGQSMLKEWLRQPSRPVPEDNELLLKLFFSAPMPPVDSCALVASFRAYLTTQMRSLASLEKVIAKGPGTREQKVHWLATLRYGQAVNRALSEWCDETTAEFKKLESD
jgi:DNA-binding PadR family transcriptional regulator